LDPKNLEVLLQLTKNYIWLSQYRELKSSYDRLIALERDKPLWKITKALVSLDEKAQLSPLRAALEALPSYTKNNEEMFSPLITLFIYSRDWTKARELVRSNRTRNYPLLAAR
jgi:hypothetical protein